LNIVVDNACKYSQPGTPIRILIRAEGELASLTIEDRGSGIREEDFSQISKPFFRSAESQRRGIEGMGLGLSIAKRLAEALGGELSFTSKFGQGSAFTVKLPRADVGTEKASDSKRQFIDASPVF